MIVVDVMLVTGIVAAPTEPFVLGLHAKIEIAGRRGEKLYVWTLVAPNVALLVEAIVAAGFFAFEAVLVSLCTGAAAALATAFVVGGRRAGTEAAVPGREEEEVLVPAPDVTVGARETGLVTGKGRVERATAMLVVDGVTVCLATTVV
jgi:hypothetical protein